MKISTLILQSMTACSSGLYRFVAVHGENELKFSDCVKSESNTIGDYFWFIRKQELNADHKKDLQHLAIEFSERVLPVFEAKYPEDNRPRKAIETAKLYLSGEATLGALKKARTDAAYATASAYAYIAAYAAYAAEAAYAASAEAYTAAYAAYAAEAASAYAASAEAYTAYAEKSWQKQRLAEIMVKWGW